MLREGFRFGVKSNENQNEIIYAQMKIESKQKYIVDSSGVVLVGILINWVAAVLETVLHFLFFSF